MAKLARLMRENNELKERLKWVDNIAGKQIKKLEQEKAVLIQLLGGMNVTFSLIREKLNEKELRCRLCKEIKTMIGPKQNDKKEDRPNS
jgi:hypothetical protein